LCIIYAASKEKRGVTRWRGSGGDGLTSTQCSAPYVEERLRVVADARSSIEDERGWAIANIEDAHTRVALHVSGRVKGERMQEKAASNVHGIARITNEWASSGTASREATPCTADAWALWRASVGARAARHGKGRRIGVEPVAVVIWNVTWSEAWCRARASWTSWATIVIDVSLSARYNVN